MEGEHCYCSRLVLPNEAAVDADKADLLLAGGDNSVRGYAYQSISPTEYDNEAQETVKTKYYEMPVENIKFLRNY